MKHFPAGTLVKVDSEFADAGDEGFDPDVVKITIEEPGDVVTTYEYGVDAAVVRDSVGVYHIDLDTTNKPGLWRYRWHSTGEGQAASDNKVFMVGRNHPVDE